MKRPLPATLFLVLVVCATLSVTVPSARAEGPGLVGQIDLVDESSAAPADAPAESPTAEPAEEPTGATPIDLHVPSVHDANEHTEDTLRPQEALPSAYDSRDAGNVTAVRNQEPYGVCWTFSTIGAIESSLLAHNSTLNASDLDLSERHLAYFTYHQQNDALGNIAGDGSTPIGINYGRDQFQSDPYLVSGGNFYVASLSLASWAGAVNEEAAPYADLISLRSEYGGVSSYPYGVISDAAQGSAFLERIALQSSLARSNNAVWLTGLRLISLQDRDDVKSAIRQHGGVAVQINSSFACRFYTQDGSDTPWCFYNSNPDLSTNHEVEIVGWDDDFDRFKFSNHHKDGTGYTEVPDAPQPLTLDQSTSFTGTEYQSNWFTFTPEAEGIYRIAVQNGSRPYVYYVSSVNGKLGYAYAPPQYNDYTSKATCAELYEGQTYYFSSYGSGDDAITVSRVADIDYSDTPAHNGAWLAKNSWGTNFSDTRCDGYIWISYDDANFRTGEVGAFLVSSTKPYDNIYQYDGGTSTNFNTVRSGGSIANVFTAHANAGGGEELRAIGLRLADVNVDYEVQVYLHPTNADDPTSGVAALSEPVRGSTDYMGYYTIDLPSPVYLGEDTSYAVVATLSHRDGTDVRYAIDTTWEYSWIKQTSAVSPHQSFERDYDGAPWDDLSWTSADERDDPSSCARIKAFTANVAARDDDKQPIANATVSVGTATYTGSACKPAVTVSLGSSTLVAGTDYTLAYKNNVNAGTGQVVITGKGRYEGTKTASFKIAAMSVSKLTVAAPAAQTYTGKALAPAPTVKRGSVALARGTDYTLSYANNTNAGTATVTVRGAGNYTGTKSVSFAIRPAASKITLAAQERTYTGKALAYTGKVTRSGSAGAVTYRYFADAKCAKAVAAAGVKDAGTYYVRATVAAKGNYAAATSAVAKLTIRPAASKISLAAQERTYTGKALAYTGKVTRSGSAGAVTYRYFADAKCAKAVAAAGVKDAGTYYVRATVAAKGNYAAATSAAAKLVVAKAANPLAARAVARTASAKTLRGKAVAVAAPLSVSGARGKLSYAKASGPAALSVAGATGKVTVAKGTKAGRYTIKVKVSAAGDANHKAGSKTVACTVTVK